MGTVIIITIPPDKRPKKQQIEVPAVGEPTVADILRDAADILDGKPD